MSEDWRGGCRARGVSVTGTTRTPSVARGGPVGVNEEGDEFYDKGGTDGVTEE